jgi:hypothetical protein
MPENFERACGIHHICKKGRICVKQSNMEKEETLSAAGMK